MNRIWDFGAFGANTALVDDTGVAVRYDELAALQGELFGVAPGELTMMLCENSIGALSGYAALLNGGHPMLMVSAGLPEDMRRQIMNDLHIRCVSSGVDDHLVIFVLSDEDADAVRNTITRKMSVVRMAFRVEVIDGFPINEAGKVLYGALLERAKRLID